ncbi:MAG TPA: PIG-L deacetylase family protein [Polyangia bacterium]|jgi:LmbE family N-acetylglucosaminyl deacetylase
MNTVLVVAAHPDDEILGCGGTMARLSRAGVAVHIAIMGEGATSRPDSPSKDDDAAVESLRHDARRAAQVVGAKDVTFFGLPDNRFDTVALLDVVKPIEKLVAALSPDTIFTHHLGDLNVDHQTVNRAVLTATRPKPGMPVKDVLAFEIASSTEWAFQHLQPVFHANTFFDISDTLAAKTRALACYATELCAFPHPRSAEALEAIGRRWGSVVGCPAAEAFEVIRSIR